MRVKPQNKQVEGAAVDMGEVLREITFPNTDLSSLDFSGGAAPQSRTQQKDFAESAISLAPRQTQTGLVCSRLVKDLFAVQQRKAWDKSTEARCDFSYKLRLTHRSNVNFISIWQKSTYGRTLTDIKADPEMVKLFSDSIVPVIKEMLGYHLRKGSWCICTSPKRRHKVKNFATLISEEIGRQLDIPFYEDVAFCHTKQRVNAVFELNILPKESNIIVYDDFVTTGQTLLAMKKLLQGYGKNLIFFTNVNNKL